MVGSNNLDPQNMLYTLYSYIQSPKMILGFYMFFIVFNPQLLTKSDPKPSQTSRKTVQTART